MDAIRNNTSFPRKLYQSFKKLERFSKKDYLQYHQRLVTEYVAKYPIRGLLVYHKMGSGKTILGIAICEELLKASNRVIFISPKSLHDNFRNAFVKYAHMFELEDIEEHINKYYSFVSLNASNMLTQVKKAAHNIEAEQVLRLREDDPLEDQRISLENSVIIWDEFHNFLNSISNGSKNAIGLYNMIMKTKNIKLLGLTGTPIVNDPYEIALGFNMLAGYTGQTYTLFGEDYYGFCKYFVSNFNSLDVRNPIAAAPSIKNRAKFQDRILGLVSYYGADTPEFLQKFPVEYELVVKRIMMSSQQFSAYAFARDKELKEVYFTVKERVRLKKPSTSFSSYRMLSRQLSNFVYPKHASKIYKDKKDKLKYDRYPSKLRPSDFSKAGLKQLSPKFLEILTMCALHTPANVLAKFKIPTASIVKKRTPTNTKQLGELGISNYSIGIGPGLVYSEFLDAGINVFASALKHYGLLEVIDTDELPDSSSGTFAIISGQVSPEARTKIIELFSKPDNANGSIITLLLVTSTGAEGISLKRCRHVHIMEPYWNWARVKQVIMRAIRLNSHADLNKSDRSVQAYIYLSVYPKGIVKDEPTTDTVLFGKALQRQMLIDEFLLAIQEASIDCSAHYNSGDHCYTCIPNNRKLWYPDINRDIHNPSPCKHYKTESVKVKSVKVNGDTYYYSDSDNTRIFYRDSELNGYVELFEDNPLYPEIYSLINLSKK